jgi:hypothetical protein
MNYRKSEQVTGSLLRPFIVAASPGEALAADDLKARVAYILEMDQEKHPDWFI